MDQQPIVVCVTGAAGQIGYSLIPMICNGNATGTERKIILNLLEIPQAQKALEGFYMELIDSSFPLVEKINLCYEPEAAFKDCDVIFLVGAYPRGPGMDRSALLTKNAPIFKTQGEAINKFAKKTVKVLVVGNPANTNARIVQEYAPDIPKCQITSMMRLDYNRTQAQLVEKTGCKVTDIKNIMVWGNHSNSMTPDVNHGTIAGRSIREVVNDDDYLDVTFIDVISKRGGAVIAARGKSSAASAAHCAICHMRDWLFGSDDIVCMGVPSNGSYGIPEGVVYGFPIKCNGNGKCEIVKDFSISEIVKERMMKSYEELVSERETALSCLKD